MTHKHFVRLNSVRGNTGSVHSKKSVVQKNSQGSGLLLFPKLGGPPEPLNTNIPEPFYQSGEGLKKKHGQIMDKIKKLKSKISLKI